MTAPLTLRKLHATGNDFLVVVDLDARFGPAGSPVAPLDERAVAALCDRSTGIGADGVLRLVPGENGADCAMELRNADGGLAEMSGNGIRCLVWAADGAGVVPAGGADRFLVDTGGGRRTVDVTRDAAGMIVNASVDMGPVTFEPAAIPVAVSDPFDLDVVVGSDHLTGDAAGMGNPHLVLVVDDVDAFPLATAGPALEHDARFPQRTNVEVITPTADGLQLRVWERGVGVTRSCGTGACAAAAVAHRRGLVGTSVAVFVLGGRLNVTVGDTIQLAGPVVHVFDTTIDLDEIVRSREIATGARV